MARKKEHRRRSGNTAIASPMPDLVTQIMRQDRDVPLAEAVTAEIAASAKNPDALPKLGDALAHLSRRTRRQVRRLQQTGELPQLPSSGDDLTARGKRTSTMRSER